MFRRRRSSTHGTRHVAGKTLTAVAVCGRAFLNNCIKKVLIVAPASVVPVWSKEFNDYANFPFEVKTLDGSVTKRKAALNNWESNESLLQVTVTNYEAIRLMEEEIEDWQPDLIICDESTRIKNPQSKQSKALHRLAEETKYRLILNGTPISNNALDLFSQYKLLNRDVFGDSYSVFCAKYAIFGGFEDRQIVGYQNMPELIEKAHSIAFRCTKEECRDLPEQIDQTLYCELEKDAKRAYNQLVKESVIEFENGDVLTAANVLARLLRLSQLSGGFMKNELGEIFQVSNAKMNLLEECLDDLMTVNRKVVIFVRFIPEINAIKELLEKKKIGYRYIFGEVPLKDRGEAVSQFQNDPEIKVFLAQIQCAGLGITLTAADTAIFYSLDFSFANYDQCRARIHRIGQKNNCNYLHLVAKGTVDEKILQALHGKRAIATEVIDNWRDYLGIGKEG